MCLHSANMCVNGWTGITRSSMNRGVNLLARWTALSCTYRSIPRKTSYTVFKPGSTGSPFKVLFARTTAVLAYSGNLWTSWRTTSLFINSVVSNQQITKQIVNFVCQEYSATEVSSEEGRDINFRLFVTIAIRVFQWGSCS